MNKIFKVSQIRDLLNQVYNEKISFSRFVEILNQEANAINGNLVKKIDVDTPWLSWLLEAEHNGLNEASLTQAIKDILNKLNEVIDKVNNQNK